MSNTDRIRGVAPSGAPTCQTCPHLLHDKKHTGWGWCDAPQNRVVSPGWSHGFTPSQSPTGTCKLHPALATPEQPTATE